MKIVGTMATPFFALLTVAMACSPGKPIEGVHLITKLADGVYIAEPKYGGGNSTIIINDDHVVVVDAQGSESAADALIEEIRRLTSDPVRFVVNTHWHGDHHGGNRAFQNQYPSATILAHPMTIRDIQALSNPELGHIAPFLKRFVGEAQNDLTTGKDKYGHTLTEEQKDQLKKYIGQESQFLDFGVAEYTYAVPDRAVTDSLILDDGGRIIEIRSVGRAHTEGDLFVYLPTERVLIAGDLVSAPYVVPRSGFPVDYGIALNRLAAIDWQHLVPGHGQVQHDRGLITRMAAFLHDCATFVRSRQGLSGDSLVTAALSESSITKHESQIDWKDERGLSFLNFASLVNMTIRRSLVEMEGKNP